jgi:hypothetical protein
MDYNRIKDLLDKYWNCETSLEEEAELHTYFSSGEVHKDLKSYAPLFQYFKSEGGIRISKDFDKKIIRQFETGKKQAKQRVLSIFYKVAAAVILILFFVTIHQRFIEVKDKAVTVVKDTFDDPEKALEETKKALLLVSEKWNKGKNNISKLSEFNKAEKIIRNENL